jgi:hypothetical protein
MWVNGYCADTGPNLVDRDPSNISAPTRHHEAECTTSVRRDAAELQVATIKTLFGEASSCAYPGCDERLIFRARGAVTVVAEIAHIRSEKRDGPAA